MRRLRFFLTVVVTVLVAGIVAVVLALLSDDGGDDVAAGDVAAADAAEPTPDLSVTAEIRRSFNRSGLVVIAITNHGDVSVDITSAALLSDSFEETGPQPFDSTIPPGDTPRDLQIEYGLATCPDGVDSTTDQAYVALTAQAEGGGEHVLELELQHPNGTLDRLLRTDCRDAALRAAVTLTMGPLEPRDDGTLTAILTVARVDGGAAPATITDSRGTVVFGISPEPDPALPPGQLRIVSEALRCGGHVIGDVKRPYAFTAWIDLGDGDPIPTAIPTDPEQRAALDEMQAVQCADRNDES